MKKNLLKSAGLFMTIIAACQLGHIKKAMASTPEMRPQKSPLSTSDHGCGCGCAHCMKAAQHHEQDLLS